MTISRSVLIRTVGAIACVALAPGLGSCGQARQPDDSPVGKWKSEATGQTWEFLPDGTVFANFQFVNSAKWHKVDDHRIMIDVSSLAQFVGTIQGDHMDITSPGWHGHEPLDRVAG